MLKMNQYLKTIQSIGTLYFDCHKQTNKHKYDHHCAKNFQDINYSSWAWKGNSFDITKAFLGWKAYFLEKLKEMFGSIFSQK